jgi:predicted ATP-binding protein involved in virulence
LNIAPLRGAKTNQYSQSFRQGGRNPPSREWQQATPNKSVNETMNPQGQEPLRIRQIRIDGLFGLYNHCINLNLKERVTILHGPNGVGKTISLRIVEALLNGRPDILSQIPFSQISLDFTDNSKIILSPPSNDEKSKLTIQEPPSLIIELIDNKNQCRKHPLSLESEMITSAYELSANIKWLVPLVGIRWNDLNQRDELSASEVVHRYFTFLPKEKQLSILNRYNLISELQNKIKTYFIDTERLLCKTENQRSSQLKPKVIEYSEELKQRIDGTLADYAHKSQALDQSFPQRLFTPIVESAKDSELKKRMARLEQQRHELREIGLLDEESTQPFNLSELDKVSSAENRAMELYIHDTEQKLSVFDDLAHSAKLLLSNINSKLKNKRLRIDREKGFVMTNDAGKNLDLDSLSSGEQHEIVLLYDLLFRIKPNTLVLIDEPELSLHVVWQKRFLPDLLKIAEVAQIDVLIATHSPYIVGDYTDLMVALETGVSRA